jgi:hypothetical protein
VISIDTEVLGVYHGGVSLMTKAQCDWGQFALLLIDLQKDFWSERG